MNGSGSSPVPPEGMARRMLVDTHCHLSDERYREDLPLVLGRAREAGVAGIVVIASDLEDARAIAKLPGLGRGGEPEEGAELRLWSTAGVHPHSAAKAPSDLRARLNEVLDEHGAVAIGECGLDFHYDFAPRDVQRRVFEEQIEVAADRDLPVVVHCREAEVEMAERVRDAGAHGVRGVLHCFGGDRPLLEAALEARWLVSFTGLVTFRTFGGEDAVRAVPADRYMLETDGPYLAPVPHRGRRNEPGFLPGVRDRIAEIRGVAASRVEAESTATALSFFRTSLDRV